jgi:hypothetical protein
MLRVHQWFKLPFYVEVLEAERQYKHRVAAYLQCCAMRGSIYSFCVSTNHNNACFGDSPGNSRSSFQAMLRSMS